ncbi:MAG: hypothetical protein HOP28_11680 [Gemmatimonadales bacterium]|nr:hypothetical protein [Gemmatimonadales bacterium]
MTSPYARPDESALAELERLFGLVEGELEAWRARCLKAEQELVQGAGPKGKGGHPSNELIQARQRISLLESENSVLRQRIALAREHLERLRTRLHFIEEQGTGDAA